jgi:hypothetical protein
MRNAHLLVPALLLGIAASALQSCSQDPQRQAAQNPHFQPPVESTDYYAERDAYYRERNQPEQPVVVERVYHTAHYYHGSPRYYTDPYSVYNDPHAHGFHRSYEDESEYEATHHEGGSKIGTAVAAGAAGVAAGVAAGYVAGRRTAAAAPASQPRNAVSPALARFGQATLVKPTATKSPKLLTPIVASAPTTTPTATYRKAPSPVFVVPTRPAAPAVVNAPAKPAARPVYKLTASAPAKRTTITVSKTRSSSGSGFFRRGRK